MGNWNSGRRPQPNALKMLRGNPGKRPINPHEPKLPPPGKEFDTPPGTLTDPDAIAEWRRLVPILRVCGLATDADRACLIAMCQQWARYLASHARSAKMFVKHNGAWIKNPDIVNADAALTQCRKLWAELGLTPAARTRILAGPGDGGAEKSKWADLA